MLHNIPEEQWSKREGVEVKCKKCDVGLCLGECFQEYYSTEIVMNQLVMAGPRKHNTSQ